MPVFRTEAEVLAGFPIALATPYFYQRWLPAIGALKAMLILLLRLQALQSHRWVAGDVLGCELTQEEIARRLGLRNRKTVGEMLKDPMVRLFVRTEPQYRSDPAQGRQRAADRYFVTMFDLLAPGDEAAAVLAGAEDLAKGAARVPVPGSGSTPGPHPVSVPYPRAAAGSAPPVSVLRTQAAAGPHHVRETDSNQLSAPHPAQGWASNGPQEHDVDGDKSSCAGTETDTLVTALVAAGIRPPVAARLVHEHDGARIRRQLEYLPYYQREGHIENTAGFLVAAVRQDYPPPRAVLEMQQREPQAAARTDAPPLPEVDWREVYRALPVAEQAELWARACEEVRGEFAAHGVTTVPQAAVWARVDHLVQERAGWTPGVADGSTDLWEHLQRCGSTHERLGERFTAWVRLERGLDLHRSPTTPDAVRDRRAAWIVLQRMGLSLRQIAACSAVDQRRVSKGLAGARSSPQVEALAAEWARAFLQILEAVGST